MENDEHTIYQINLKVEDLEKRYHQVHRYLTHQTW